MWVAYQELLVQLLLAGWLSTLSENYLGNICVEHFWKIGVGPPRGKDVLWSDMGEMTKRPGWRGHSSLCVTRVRLSLPGLVTSVLCWEEFWLLYSGWITELSFSVHSALPQRAISKRTWLLCVDCLLSFQKTSERILPSGFCSVDFITRTPHWKVHLVMFSLTREGKSVSEKQLEINHERKIKSFQLKSVPLREQSQEAPQGRPISPFHALKAGLIESVALALFWGMPHDFTVWISSNLICSVIKRMPSLERQALKYIDMESGYPRCRCSQYWSRGENICFCFY